MDILRLLLRYGAADIMDLPAIAEIDVRRYSDDFTLNDPGACADCRLRHAADTPPFVCDEVTMKVHPLNPVAVYTLDRWVKEFPYRHRENLPNCDFILADADDIYASRKIAFCDLSCSSSEYVNPGGSTQYPMGKRAYSLRQMSSMAEWLMKNPTLHHHIATATDRRYIFGIRYTDTPPVDDAAQSMHSFSMTPASEATSITTTQDLNGITFDFVKITYPEALRW